MINLASTDKIQIITGSAGDVECHASYVDLVTATSVITPGRVILPSISTAATTDFVTAPAAGTIRNVKFISVHNKHHIVYD